MTTPIPGSVTPTPPALSGPPSIPHTLEGRTDCLICHIPADEKTATPTPTPMPTALGSPPSIPHALEGRTDCLICHAAGIAGATAVPANHAGRPSNTCNLCHKQGGP